MIFEMAFFYFCRVLHRCPVYFWQKYIAVKQILVTLVHVK